MGDAHCHIDGGNLWKPVQSSDFVHPESQDPRLYDRASIAAFVRARRLTAVDVEVDGEEN